MPSRATGIPQSAFRELLEARREARPPKVALAQRPDGRAIHAYERFDQVIEELRLKDEHPDALGDFEFESIGAFIAGS